MSKSPDNRRLAARVKEVLASLLPSLKDPRIGFVTITDVQLRGDNEHARVFYTVLDDDPESRKRTAEGLDSAAPLLRRELGARLHVRRVPSLEFRLDPVPDRARSIDRLIADALRHEDG